MLELREGSTGRITVVADPFHTETLQKAFQTHFAQSSELFQWLPVTTQDIEEVDCLVFLLPGDQASYEICLRLEIPCPHDLGPDAYAIVPVIGTQGKRLAVIAGNAFGLLTGAWDVLERLQVTENGLRFHGTSSVERPAFTHRFFWTWDHSANWSDSSGQVDWGCNNAYCKPPEAFIGDYYELIDYAPRARVNGVTIVGFLRDDHGGAGSAQQVLDYGRADPTPP